MKKTLLRRITILALVSILIVSLISCSAESDIDETKSDFYINNMSAGLGSINENDLDNSRYTYTIYLASGNKKIEQIAEVKLIYGDKIADKIITESPIEIVFNKDYVEINGDIVFDTKGLGKEQIVELEPYIYSLNVILKDKSESIIQLNWIKQTTFLLT